MRIPNRRRGLVHLSEKPGLGIELDEEMVERDRVRGRYIHLFVTFVNVIGYVA